MQTANLWHKLHIHRAKIIALILLLSATGLVGQTRKAGITLHRVESDKKPVKYGFMLGVHQNWYGVKYSDQFSQPAYDQVSSISGISRPGFDLGFMVNFRLDDQFWLRVVPVKIGLYQNLVRYFDHNGAGNIGDQLVESTRIEPGIFLKYRSIRRNNSRMYVVGGISGSFRSGQEDLATTVDRLEIRRANIKLEFGVGLEQYFQFFKFAPEIRYARGIMNVMNDTDNFWHNGIGRLVTHNFTLYLHFSD